MTRETRIGLLVGLVFIVAFGVLLSELTGRSAPAPPAPAAAGENMGNYLPTPMIEEPPDAGATHADAHGGPVELAGGGPEIIEAGVVPPRPDAAGGTVRSELRPPATALTASPSDGAPAHAAGPAAAAAPAPPRRTYKVESRDTLWAIAGKVYGRGNEPQYKRILEANRGDIANPAALPVGLELVIPPPATEAARPAPPPAAAPPAAPAVRPAGPAGPAGPRYAEVDVERLRDYMSRRGRSAAPAARVYVVQRGDSLSKIARKFLNDDSAAAVRKLFEANRDRIASPNELPAGIEIHIPPGNAG